MVEFSTDFVLRDYRKSPPSGVSAGHLSIQFNLFLFYPITNIMKPIIYTTLFASSAAFGLSLVPLNAQNTFYAPGDLVLCFQKEGNTNTVYANLGNAATAFRGTKAGAADGTNRTNFVDLGAQLTSAFGAGWASDPTVYTGAAGVWGTSNLNTTSLQDGDPNRTIYITRARTAIGTVGSPNSNQWDLSLAGSGAMTSAAAGIYQQNLVLETQYTTAAAISNTTISQIDDQNPFLSPGIQGAAMQGSLEGGIQQVGRATSLGTFGTAGSVEFALDLYRVLAITTAPGQVAGDLRMGSYEGTVTVNSSGQVSFIAKATTIPKPEIDVQQPPGSSLVDGTSKKSFGTVVVGQTGAAKTFTIKNTGTGQLSGLTLMLDGAQAADFIVSSLTKTSLVAGGKTTFTVKFKPSAKKTRTAAIHIKSNDANENPFDIQLTGLGA